MPSSGGGGFLMMMIGQICRFIGELAFSLNRGGDLLSETRATIDGARCAIITPRRMSERKTEHNNYLYRRKTLCEKRKLDE